MATSNLNLLILSLPHSEHQCTSSSSSSSSSSSQTPEATNTIDAQNINSVSDGLKIKIPSSGVEFGEDDPETPRSIDNRIPVIAACPPAPRKARKVPVTRKRKAAYFSVPADFIVYVEAMVGLNERVYVPDIVVGDLGKADHIAKKLKLLPPEQNP